MYVFTTNSCEFYSQQIVHSVNCTEQEVKVFNLISEWFFFWLLGHEPEYFWEISFCSSNKYYYGSVLCSKISDLEIFKLILGIL